ncbi:MAG: hypothetical protein ACTSWW_02310 [Promethearchaeota archaeon]
MWAGGTCYVTDEKGKRIICPHPGEIFTITRVLKYRLEDLPTDPDFQALLKERVGNLADCVCLDCINSFAIDLKRDPKNCSKCKSTNIIPVKDLNGKECPKCHNGIIHCHDTGMIS